MPTRCQILFDHPQKVYYAGEMLSGTVHLTLTKEKIFRGIYIRIYGKAKASFSEYCANKNCKGNIKTKKKDDNKTVTPTGHYVVYSNKEHFFYSEIYFVGGKKDEITLQPGTYKYTFQRLLPAKLPTTMEHKVGYVRYGAKVTINIPFWMDKKFKSRFTVITRKDLNVDSFHRSPVTDKDEKVFYPFGCLCCCPSSPLEVSALAPVRGYTPGQIINLKINVSNTSNEPLHRFEVDLIKIITFSAKSSTLGHIDEQRSKTYKCTVAKRIARGCPRGKDSIDVDLTVPPIPPTDCTSTSIVEVQYYIRINGLIVTCFNGNVKLKLPIIIGTHPIQDTNPASTSNVFAISYPRPVITDQPRAQEKQMKKIVPNAPPMSMPMPMPMSIPMPSAPTISDSNITPDPNDDLPTYEKAMETDAENENHSTKL